MNNKKYSVILIDAEVDNIRLVLNEKQLELLDFLIDLDCLTCTVVNKVEDSRCYDLS